MFDYSKLTYRQMADIVRSIAAEVKERNPIFVNLYLQSIHAAVASLEEISSGEVDNPTSASGPKETA